MLKRVAALCGVPVLDTVDRVGPANILLIPGDTIDQTIARVAGVTERTAYILRVRHLAIAICKEYAAQQMPVVAEPGA